MANPIKVINGLLDREQRVGEFIAGPDQTGLPGAVQSGYRHRCREFANLPGWARALSGVAGGSINRICKPYFDDNGWDGPQASPPPFQGGQCPAQYNLSVTRAATGTTATTNPPSLPGPITGFTATDTGSGPSGTRRIEAVFTSAAGNATVVSFLPPANIEVTPNVTRQDGQPDSCGDPPAGPPRVGINPPPNPGPLPGPEPTNNPDPSDPTPIIPLPPFADPVFGPQPIVGPSEGAPEAETTPQPSGDNQPGEPDAVGNPIGDGVGEDSGEDFNFGEPPSGKIWVGCLVEFSVSNAYGNIPNTGPENTVYPLTVGNVSLRYGNVRGTSRQVRSRWTELFRPNTALEVTGAFVQTRPNTTANVRPISVTVCKESQCTGE